MHTPFHDSAISYSLFFLSLFVKGHPLAMDWTKVYQTKTGWLACTFLPIPPILHPSISPNLFLKKKKNKTNQPSMRGPSMQVVAQKLANKSIKHQTYNHTMPIPQQPQNFLIPLGIIEFNSWISTKSRYNIVR